MKNLIITLIATLTGGSLAFAAENAPAVPKDYPLKTCVVSGEEIGSGGMVPYKVTHEGTDVWLCCKTCNKKFAKDPAKYTQPVKDPAKKS